MQFGRKQAYGVAALPAVARLGETDWASIINNITAAGWSLGQQALLQPGQTITGAGMSQQAYGYPIGTYGTTGTVGSGVSVSSSSTLLLLVLAAGAFMMMAKR